MRVICLIVDAFGIGEMPDVVEIRPRDIGANTLLNVAMQVGGLYLPFMESLGLGNLVPVPGIKSIGDSAIGSYGRLILCHQGADSYMGHQELMGTIPRIHKRVMDRMGPVIQQHLEESGHEVGLLVEDASCLLVDGKVVVADCMEADPGMSVNVTASLDDVSLDNLMEISELVRQTVSSSRVIIIGGKGFTVEDIRSHIIRVDDAIGVHTAKLCPLDSGLTIKHLGYPVNLEGQAPTMVRKMGYPVHLIGKAADVIRCDGCNSLTPMIDTESVFRLIHMKALESDEWLIVANIMETDLAGHEEDPKRWARLLSTIDQNAAELVHLIGDDGVLIITGDHGNDPTTGHGQHSREITPLLFFSQYYRPRDLGMRETLADVGATIADLFGAGSTDDGTSILGDLVPVNSI